MTDQAAPNGQLDPRYQPATQDSGVLLRFIGNTAVVGEIKFIGRVDAMQLLGLATWLKHQAMKMIVNAEVAAEREARREAIQVAGAGFDPAAAAAALARKP